MAASFNDATRLACEVAPSSALPGTFSRREKGRVSLVVSLACRVVECREPPKEKGRCQLADRDVTPTSVIPTSVIPIHRIPRQPAPTTADIKQILPRLQAQLAAQVAEFVLLGLIDGFAAGFEITAGIRHVPDLELAPLTTACRA